MNVILSRRLGRAFYLADPPPPPAARDHVIRAAATARSFADLPPQVQAMVLAWETSSMDEAKRKAAVAKAVGLSVADLDAAVHKVNEGAVGDHRARHLIRWYNRGADGQIPWGSPGDFNACVRVYTQATR